MGAVLWAAVVGYVSLVPRPPEPPGAGLLAPGVWPLAAHVAMYAVLGGLVVLAVRSTTSGPRLTIFPRAYWAGIAIPSAYGVALELMQRLVPNRAGTWQDALADASGAAAAVTVAAAVDPAFRRWRAHRVLPASAAGPSGPAEGALSSGLRPVAGGRQAEAARAARRPTDRDRVP